MPKGFYNHTGKHPEYAELYGIQEHPSPKYPPRTFLNVKESDATVRFAKDFKSPGELCTLKAIRQYNKPFFDVDVLDTPTPPTFRKWLEENKVEVLNVAGNSEKTCPGIEKLVISYLVGALQDIEVWRSYIKIHHPLNDDTPLWQYFN